MKLESLSFSDRFDIQLEKRLSGVAGLMYIMSYGICQLILLRSGTLKLICEKRVLRLPAGSDSLV